MSDVFISYSRKDSAFIQKVFQALENLKFTAWVDWSDIYKGEKWLEAIYSGIETADTFIFVLTPDSLKSEVCHKEIAHARRHKKRIIPIVHHVVEQDNQLLSEIHNTWFEQNWEATARANWAEIKAINWLYFRDTDNFDTGVQTLIDALRTDVVRVRQHTQFLTRALQWDRNNRNASILLQGDELNLAEEWLANAETAEAPPLPTELLRDYIAASHDDHLRRLKNARRLKQAAAGVAVFTILAIIATLALYNRAESTDDARATEQWESSVLALREARDGTVAAGIGIIPPTPPLGTVPNPQLIETVTQIAHLNTRPTEVAVFDGVEMVRVPAGCFWMGSTTAGEDEQPVTEICFTTDFWLDRYEVTNAQFERLDGVTASPEIDCPASNHPQAPRACLTAQEAHVFCTENRGQGARLPTEAEWEYAARGPDSLVYPWGNSFDPTKVVYGLNPTQAMDAEGFPIGLALPVGSFDTDGSWVGAVDMSGNVLEWVSSLDAPYPYATDDGRENTEDTSAWRIMRGGSFTDADESGLRSSMRGIESPTAAMNYIGFRCARE